MKSNNEKKKERNMSVNRKRLTDYVGLRWYKKMSFCRRWWDWEICSC